MATVRTSQEAWETAARLIRDFRSGGNTEGWPRTRGEFDYAEKQIREMAAALELARGLEEIEKVSLYGGGDK